MVNGLSIVHELPGRLRLRLPCLRHPFFALTDFEDTLMSLEGVEQARANPAARSLLVEYDGRAEVRNALLKRLAALSPHQFLHSEPAEPSRHPDLSPLAASSLALLVLPLLPIPLRALVTLISVSPTLYKGFITLVKRGVKVEVLDALAVGVAAGQGSFFTANVTHLLLETGQYIERQAEQHTHRLLRQLLKRTPQKAWVERDGTLVQIDAQAIRKGEKVIVGPSDPLPVDGRIAQGSALLDQSSLTGESVPVRKEVGDRVLSGCVVVEGRLEIQASQVGAQTAAARLGRFIEEALQRPAESQRLAERLGDHLVYLVFGLGSLIFTLTFDPRRLASVFLVDYSCALKLGTPLAFKAGMHDAARAGILFKGAQALEDLASADTIVFDKTGTLTHSKLEITDIIPLVSGHSKDQLLALAASLEEHTRHPYAEALVRYAQSRGYPHVDHGAVEFVIAHGLHSQVNGRKVFVGSRHYLETHLGVPFTSHEPLISDQRAEGKSLLYVAEGKILIGLVALRDQVREDAVATLAQLKALGIGYQVMLTGDDRHRAESLARQLGIDRLYAEQAPEEKAQVIEELKAVGRKVMFVGDGVNDAAALVSAPVGVAMPRAALLSREAADVILLRDDLESLAQARQFAVGTQELIRSNFYFDVAVNSVLLLAASLGWVPAVAAALMHNGTTLAILVRSLRKQIISGAVAKNLAGYPGEARGAGGKVVPEVSPSQ
jgi:manganese/zinc-transporting P-type ATPase C